MKPARVLQRKEATPKSAPESTSFADGTTAARPDAEEERVRLRQEAYDAARLRIMGGDAGTSSVANIAGAGADAPPQPDALPTRAQTQAAAKREAYGDPDYQRFPHPGYHGYVAAPSFGGYGGPGISQPHGAYSPASGMASGVGCASAPYWGNEVYYAPQAGCGASGPSADSVGAYGMQQPCGAAMPWPAGYCVGKAVPCASAPLTAPSSQDTSVTYDEPVA